MKLKIYSILFILSLAFAAKAQDTQEQPLDTLTRHVAGIRSELDVLKRIKVTGYIQAQFQVADSGGAASFAGGNFPTGTDKRFQLRRGRVKVQYDSPVNDKGWSTSQYVFQIDVSQGGVTVKDLYAKFTDPWSGWFSVIAGMQNRPFGYEIGYSSSLRESPERGRMSQTIFPNERDLGAMISIQGPKTSNWNWLKIDGGLFNGTGGPSAGANTSDFDKFKDFIGHISANRSNKSEKIKWGLGASIYNGGYRHDQVDAYKMGTDSLGIPGYNVDISKATISSDINARKEIKREYIGGDGQVSIDWAAGITTIRAEYIQGEQPGTSSSTTSLAASATATTTTSATTYKLDTVTWKITATTTNTTTTTGDMYKRKFNGAYFYFLQNIAQTPFQAIIKYDWYDPNTDVEGDDIGKKVTSGTKATNAADIKFTTLGLGLAYRWDANIKLTAYYDMVTNETSANLAGYNKDILDNVFTIRAQVKF